MTIEHKVKNKRRVTWKSGCGIVFVGAHLLVLLLILTMCRVPKKSYEPYLTAGKTYYQAVLGVAPTISSEKYYHDEGGGFTITIEFTPEQLNQPLVKLYSGNRQSLSVRGTSTESKIVGISKESTKNLETAKSFGEFNQPVFNMLRELLTLNKEEVERAEFQDFRNVIMCSTDLTFWKKVLVNYEGLKNKPFKERFDWLAAQTDDKTFFLLSAEVTAGEHLFEMLKRDVFPVEKFPVGTIFKLKSNLDNESVLYQSDKNYQLVKSKNDYPVTY